MILRFFSYDCHFCIYFDEDFAFRNVFDFDLIFVYDVSYRLRLIFYTHVPVSVVEKIIFMH